MKLERIDEGRFEDRASAFEAWAMRKAVEIVNEYKALVGDGEELYLTMSYLKGEDGERISINNNYWELDKNKVQVWHELGESND